MKAKLMALVLAAGLGVTGITATAHAAGAAESGCSHPSPEATDEVDTYGVYTDPTYHLIINRVTYFCSACGVFFPVEESGGYEAHDYELFYCDDGKVVSRCTVCGDVW